MKQRRKVTGAVLLGLALVATQSLGDDFPNNGKATDGRYVTACWNMTEIFPRPLNLHWQYLTDTVASQTNLTFDLDIQPCLSTTDMVFMYHTGTPYPAVGAVWCLNEGGQFAQTASTTDIECDSWAVTVNLDRLINDVCSHYLIDDDLMEQNVWCHESGHALGLYHIFEGPGGCMAHACSSQRIYVPEHLDHLDTY